MVGTCFDAPVIIQIHARLHNQQLNMTALDIDWRLVRTNFIDGNAIILVPQP
jgi:hypothetical protein